jgi:hypothetical protein
LSHEDTVSNLTMFSKEVLTRLQELNINAVAAE